MSQQNKNGGLATNNPEPIGVISSSMPRLVQRSTRGSSETVHAFNVLLWSIFSLPCTELVTSTKVNDQPRY